MSIRARFNNVEILRNIFSGIRSPLIEAHLSITREVIDLYRDSIALVRAIYTGYFRNTVRQRELRHAATTFTSVVASDAPYSLVVETGWINRAGGQASYPGRWPGRIAADGTVLIVGPAFDISFNNYFGRF